MWQSAIVIAMLTLWKGFLLCKQQRMSRCATCTYWRELPPGREGLSPVLRILFRDGECLCLRFYRFYRRLIYILMKALASFSWSLVCHWRIRYYNWADDASPTAMSALNSSFFFAPRLVSSCNNFAQRIWTNVFAGEPQAPPSCVCLCASLLSKLLTIVWT